MGIAWNGAEASCDEFRRILEECGHKRRAMYLAQASSGMRIGEITQISREHLHTDTDKTVVKIPARIAKKRDKPRSLVWGWHLQT